MSKVTFKLPFGIKVVDKTTGFTGTINNRLQMINGCIQYAVQPPVRKGSTFVPDGLRIDEVSLMPVDKNVEYKPEVVTFKYDTGDKVKSRVNGFEGIITHRMQFLNGCISYRVEGQMQGKEEVCISQFEQELTKISDGLNAAEEEPVKRKRTGGPSERVTTIEKAW